MPSYNQENRPVGVSTPLGPNKLLLLSFRGTERVSGLFGYTLEMFSTEEQINAQHIVGKSVDFFVRFADGTERFFNGIVRSFSYIGSHDRGHLYRAEVVPRLWLLTRSSDCRVHVSESPQTVKYVVENLLRRLGITDYQWKVTETLRTRPYVVQYNETDFDFFSRLLEEEGIFYFFRHEAGKHVLVMADNHSSYYEMPESSVTLSADLSTASQLDSLYSWSVESCVTTSAWKVSDYNPDSPLSSLMASKNSLMPTKHEGSTWYDFPADHEQTADGARTALRRLEHEESGQQVASGTGSCRSFSPGGKFTLSEHYNAAWKGKEWVVTEVSHEANLGGSYISGAGEGDRIYQNSFRCIPALRKCRPQRIRKKSRVYGVHSAVVTGPTGEEIYTDAQGRIKIQFHWDLVGSKRAVESSWVRVATVSASNGWGMIRIPRIGEEVLVSFIDGDPDRPVVTGMLYNAVNVPPYTLPEFQTVSGLRSRSSPNGDSETYNEIRIEDHKDSEEIRIHAEKDLTTVVEHNESHSVGYDKGEVGGTGAEDESAGKGNQIVKIFNSQSVKVGNHRNTLIDQGNDALTLNHGNLTTVVKEGSVFTTVSAGNMTTQVNQGHTDTTLEKGNMTTLLKDGNVDITLEKGKMTSLLTEGAFDQTLSKGNMTIVLKEGDLSTKLDNGAVEFNASNSITLKVGENSIVIDQQGITIKGMKIEAKADGTAALKGASVEVSGSGMTAVKGGIVNIN